MALVTGAGRRLGRSIALGLAQAGYAIGLHYFQSEEAARQTADEIRSLGVPVELLQADLCRESEVQALFAHLAGLPYRLRVLVNSAGRMDAGRLEEMSPEAWDRLFALNLRAPWRCGQAAAHLMAAAGGVIINITDSGAGKAWTGYAAYSISKSGLETLTHLQARSLAPAIRVNAVAPGLVLPAAGFPAEDWQRLNQRVPLQHPVAVKSIVDAVLFLISSEDITGQTLVVDGGYQLL
jgi:pteridine reductase